MYENRMSPIKLSKKGGEEIRKCNRGDEFDQSTLYACMKISQ
jgi:hypothetical protein